MKKHFFTVLIVIILILTLCFPLTSKAAFNFWHFNKGNSSTIINNKYTDIDNYKKYLNNLSNYTNQMNTNSDISSVKIDLIDKMTELQKNYSNSANLKYINKNIK